MEKAVSIWYDAEGDFLEVLFEKKAGYFRETSHEAVLEKVDNDGSVIGFSIQAVSQLKNQPPIAAVLNLDRAA